MLPKIEHINIVTGEDASVHYRILYQYAYGQLTGNAVPLAIVLGKDGDEAEERAAVLGCAYEMLFLLESIESDGAATEDALNKIHALLKQIEEG